MNSSVLAALHSIGEVEQPRGIRALRTAAGTSASGTLSLSQHMGIRFIFAGWEINRSQRDAAEFTHHMLQKAGFAMATWEARIRVREEHQTVDAGQGLIFLELPSGACDLQELMNAWATQAHPHALTHAPESFAVQLGRFPHRGKSLATVRFQQPVRVPVFHEGVVCQWFQYEAVAGVIHYGHSAHAGHYRYRAVLKGGDNWLITDDAVASTPCEITSEHRRGLYVVWLKKSAGVEPVTREL